MELSTTPAQILGKLQEERVAQWTTLAEQVGCSTKSVQRALAKVGYFGSINHNGLFATAKGTPRFDQRGLWVYQTVCFSQHGNLPQTLHRLVEQSPAGHTVEELERLVGTRVHNHVSRLIREGKLERCFQGRKVVYLATDVQRRESQQQTRRQAERRPVPTVPQTDLPPGLDAPTVIHVLRRLLETPEASVASVARALQARQLQSLAQEFPQIPCSSLYDVQHKFLFYFGHLHRQSAPLLSEWFLKRGGSTWLIDATLEAGTPMYFGIYEAQDNLLLDAYRIPSENVDAISPCLTQTAGRFGKPRRVLHDLSEAMAAACERALEVVPHTVCHFHFLRDIGTDLYAVPQARLRDRLRQLKLQTRLKEQRNALTDWLREHLENPRLLAEVLLGKRAEMSAATAGREVVIAYHQWLLDYSHDGRRQGFPFEP